MPEASDDPRVYLAAERTFLAWIRTGLGLMGVGFALARFGLFLRELRADEIHQPAPGNGASLYSGIAIVALGVLVNFATVFHHIRLVGALRAGTWKPGIARNAVALSLFLALVGVGLCVYLLLLRA